MDDKYSSPNKLLTIRRAFLLCWVALLSAGCRGPQHGDLLWHHAGITWYGGLAILGTGNTPATRESVEYLLRRVGADSIKELTIYCHGTVLSAKDLAVLPQMDAVEFLSVIDTPPSERVDPLRVGTAPTALLAALAQIQCLESVHITAGRVGAEGLHHLGRLPNLKYLKIQAPWTMQGFALSND